MTVLGKHTIAETRDLMRSLQFRINACLDQQNKILMARSGPPTEKQFQTEQDLKTLVLRWNKVRDEETRKLTILSLGAPLVPAHMQPSEDSYVAVNKAVAVDFPRLITVQQQLDVQSRELEIPELNFDKIPPQDSPDMDFAALKKLDSAIAEGEKQAKAAAGTVKEAAKSNVGLMIGLGLAGAAGVVVLTKVYL